MQPQFNKQPETRSVEDTKERQSRELNVKEQRVRNWIRANHGVLSQVARETGKSIQFVQRIAYNRADCRSAEYIVEKALLRRGCPLIQRVKE